MEIPLQAQANAFSDRRHADHAETDSSLQQFQHSPELFDFSSQAGFHGDNGIGQMDTGMMEFVESVYAGDLALTDAEGRSAYDNAFANITTSSGGLEAKTASLLDTEDHATIQNLGYSSEGDPFFLQFYRYDAEGKIRFKELTTRQVSQQHPPVCFFVGSRTLTQKGHPPSKEALGTHERLAASLPTIVPLETGRRLLALYDRFLTPLYPIFAEEQRPTAEGSEAHLLAAIYLSTQPFLNFDEKLCIDLVRNAGGAILRLTLHHLRCA